MRIIAPHIIIDPAIRFGKPVIKGTRITVDEALGALAGGMDFAEIEKEYGVTREGMRAAVNYAATFLKGVDVVPAAMAAV
jgi:uncharacterized protein (DUF433 family)